MTLIRLRRIILRNFLVPIHDMDCIWPNQLVPECQIRKSAKKIKKTIPTVRLSTVTTFFTQIYVFKTLYISTASIQSQKNAAVQMKGLRATNFNFLAYAR